MDDLIQHLHHQQRQQRLRKCAADHHGRQGAYTSHDDLRLYCSTNLCHFKINKEALSDCVIEDISSKMIPEDFARDAKIHYCWKIYDK